MHVHYGIIKTPPIIQISHWPWVSRKQRQMRVPSGIIKLLPLFKFHTGQGEVGGTDRWMST